VASAQAREDLPWWISIVASWCSAPSPDQSGVKSLLPCCSALARNGSSSANGSGKSAAASDSGPSSRQAAAFV